MPKSQITFTKAGVVRGLAPLPRSRATTAWGLLQDVKRVMRKEPKRVDMNSYVAQLKNRAYLFKPGRADTYDDPTDLQRQQQRVLAQFPACGTTGCFAGWVCVLAGKPEASASADCAKSILGRGCQYTLGRAPGVPSYSATEEVFDDGGTLPTTAVAGTPKYAEAVCARIDRFMAVNEKKLKAKKLTPRLTPRTTPRTRTRSTRTRKG